MGRNKRSNQIYESLKQAITAGTYQTGEFLPKELELAEQLQVSRGTLRIALDQLEQEKIIERVKRLGTIILPLQGKIHKILVLVGITEGLEATVPSVLQGIQYEAMQRNISCVQIEYGYINDQPQESALKSISESGVSGIIVLANHFNGTEPIIPTLKKTGLPILLPHTRPRDLDTTGFDMIMYTDQRESLQMGLDYLVGLGHRRIAFIGNIYWRGYFHEEEYFSDLAEAGAETDRSLFCQIEHFDQAQLEKEIKRLFQMKSPPTAIYCVSDYFAFAVYQHLHKLNIRIPDQVSVLATGGNIGGDYMSPQLSVVDYQYHNIGRLAVENIISLIDEKKPLTRLVITPSKITIRQSCQNISMKSGRKIYKQKESAI